MAEWLMSGWPEIVGVVATTLGIYVALVVFTRLAGLRSFSKMSSFDFAITVAFGSVVAGTAMAKDPPLLQGVTALGTLYLVQHLVAQLRRRKKASSLVDNDPIVLMIGRDVLQENLTAAGMTDADLRSKLREANVLDYDEIRAVVCEATGDVSVLHGDPDGPSLDPDLLQDVRGAERLR